MTPVSALSSAAPSPSFQYPTGPPPPYSHPASHVAPSPAPPSGMRTPPDARRMSADDTDKPQPKQSLPSIHEALGVPTQSSYSTAQHPSHPAPAPQSPPASRRSFGMEPPPPPSVHTAPYPTARRSPGPQYRSDVSPRTAQDHFERARPTYNTAPPPPVLPTRNGYSPGHAPAPYPPHPYASAEPSPVTHRAPAHTASMPPPAAPFSHGYSAYSRPSYTAPYATPSSGAVYQPSITQPAPAHPASSRAAIIEPDRNVYGESVKRHLDMYDFEAALNEIADSSSYTLDFTRQLGARMHQSQRSGPVPATLPAVHEIDDLMARSRGTLECLGRMRETVVAQQAAYYQQAQEQQHYKAQDDLKRDSVHDESKAGGFAGAEAKKRRGRAAPPGRCHSCQRAETPEWRRGPDGARTLCNACGLRKSSHRHIICTILTTSADYAKLTRKQGAQKAAIGSSNLRPKAGSSEQPDIKT